MSLEGFRTIRGYQKVSSGCSDCRTGILGLKAGHCGFKFMAFFGLSKFASFPV
jgi:hypothetical protein